MGARKPALSDRQRRSADQSGRSEQRRGGLGGAKARRDVRRDGSLRSKSAVLTRELERRYDGADDQPAGFRDASRVQPRAGVQGALGSGACAVVAASVDERFAALVPGDVDVLALNCLQKVMVMESDAIRSAGRRLADRTHAHLTAEFLGVALAPQRAGPLRA